MQAGKASRACRASCPGAWSTEGEAARMATSETGAAPWLPGKSLSGTPSSGKPRLALCGLALIDAVEIPVDYSYSAETAAREKRLSNQDLHIHRSSRAIGGIAELAAFKLQWICSDRNIDGARKVWARGRGFGRVGPGVGLRVLHSAVI